MWFCSALFVSAGRARPNLVQMRIRASFFLCVFIYSIAISCSCRSIMNVSFVSLGRAVDVKDSGSCKKRRMAGFLSCFYLSYLPLFLFFSFACPRFFNALVAGCTQSSTIFLRTTITLPGHATWPRTAGGAQLFMQMSYLLVISDLPPALLYHGESPSAAFDKKEILASR